MLAGRLGIEVASIAPIRAHLSIDARRALREHALDERLETELKLLTLHYVNSAVAGHTLEHSAAEIRSAALRLGVSGKSLKDAVHAFAASMLPDDGEQDLRTASMTKSYPAMSRSPESRVQLRRAVLREFGLRGTEAGGAMDAELAAGFKIPESSIPAVRAWVGKIFLARICKAEAIELGESFFPAVLGVASWLNQRGLNPDAPRATDKLKECAAETGLQESELQTLLRRFLTRF